MQKSNVNRASVCALCYQYVTHGPYCDTASATCIMSTCACNKSFVRHETGSVQRSTSQMQQLATTTYNPRRHPTCRTHHSTCNVRYATYASDGEGHVHTHTHTMQPPARTEEHGRGGHTNCLGELPCMGETCHDGVRRGRSCKQTNNSRSRSAAAVGRRQWHAAARPPRRDPAALGRGSGCARVLQEQR